MTCNEITAMLGEADLPLAYDHFAEGESPDPPFLIFLFPRSKNFSADDSVYVKVDELHIELYTDKKDPVCEKKVEDVLDSQGIFYDKDEVWIGEEQLYEVLYSTEVVKDE